MWSKGGKPILPGARTVVLPGQLHHGLGLCAAEVAAQRLETVVPEPHFRRRSWLSTHRLWEWDSITANVSGVAKQLLCGTHLHVDKPQVPEQHATSWQQCCQRYIIQPRAPGWTASLSASIWTGQPWPGLLHWAMHRFS
eukprot:jgi/Ulvmu1/8363/UM042_0069.1